MNYVNVILFNLVLMSGLSSQFSQAETSESKSPLLLTIELMNRVYIDGNSFGLMGTLENISDEKVTIYQENPFIIELCRYKGSCFDFSYKKVGRASKCNDSLVHLLPGETIEFGLLPPFYNDRNYIALDITQYAKTIKKDEQVMIQAKWVRFIDNKCTKQTVIKSNRVYRTYQVKP
jgi:hypothetical protein